LGAGSGSMGSNEIGHLDDRSAQGPGLETRIHLEPRLPSQPGQDQMGTGPIGESKHCAIRKG